MKHFQFLSVFYLLVLTTSCASTKSTLRIPASADMEYVNVCDRNNICKKFSRLIMGTDHLIQGDWTGRGEAEKNEAEYREVLDEAVKLGINIFDTSPIYVGDVENRLGKWLKDRREVNPSLKLYTLTKGGFPFDLFWAQKLEIGSHSNELKDQLRNQGILGAPSADGTISLKDAPPGTYASRLFGSKDQIITRVSEEVGHSYSNLHGDITIYLMHRDDNDFVGFQDVSRKQTSVRTIMEALRSSELSQKYWMIGWSNWKTNRVNESIKLAQKDPSLPQPLINSPYFSLFEMSKRSIHAGGIQVTHSEMQDRNFQRGIKMMPYSPLGGFSILDKPEPQWENAKKAAQEKYTKGDPYWQNVFHAVFTPENEARFERVVKFTKAYNQKNKTDYTLDQMINAYALAHRRVDFLTIGPITVAQLRRTVDSLKLARQLSESDLDYLYGEE